VIDPQKPVRVIRNWKRDCYTILQNGLPQASAKQVRLADVEFQVRESGRNRMLSKRKRNVHAYAIGRLIEYTHPDEDRDIAMADGRGVAYYPYQRAAFVDIKTNATVNSAPFVDFHEDGVYYQVE
jgi:hypothetical protein